MTSVKYPEHIMYADYTNVFFYCLFTDPYPDGRQCLSQTVIYLATHEKVAVERKQKKTKYIAFAPTHKPMDESIDTNLS